MIFRGSGYRVNQLQAVALNEGLRYKKRLWRETGRQQLESLSLARWSSRRRQDLLELLDGISPAIAELTAATEQEAEKYPEAQRLMTHPGVGALSPGVRTDHRGGGALRLWQTDRRLSRSGAGRRIQWRTAAPGAHQ